MTTGGVSVLVRSSQFSLVSLYSTSILFASAEPRVSVLALESGTAVGSSPLALRVLSF